MSPPTLSRRNFLALIGSSAAVTCLDRRAYSAEPAALPQPDWRTLECASTDGTVIKYRIMGTRGTPLVIVHGGASSAQSYYATARLLAEKHRIFLIERRNYGFSEDSRTPTSYQREGEDVHAVIKAIGENCYLFGHSGGALVSMCAALDATNLRKVMLYEPPLLASGKRMEPIVDHYRKLAAAGDLRTALANSFNQVTGSPMESAYKTADRIVGMPAPLRHRLLFALECEMQSLLQLDPNPEAWTRMAQPIVLLTGDQSVEQPLRASIAALHRHLHGSKVVTLNGQGHIANALAPQMLANALRAELA
jgi:pimeloyl-ACP methyl ester carboxylesterase